MADVQGIVPSTAALLIFRPGGYEAKALFTTGFRKFVDTFLLNMLAFVTLCRIVIKLCSLASYLNVEINTAENLLGTTTAIFQIFNSSLEYAYSFHAPMCSLGKILITLNT